MLVRGERMVFFWPRFCDNIWRRFRGRNRRFRSEL